MWERGLDGSSAVYTLCKNFENGFMGSCMTMMISDPEVFGYESKFNGFSSFKSMCLVRAPLVRFRTRLVFANPITVISKQIPSAEINFQPFLRFF